MCFKKSGTFKFSLLFSLTSTQLPKVFIFRLYNFKINLYFWGSIKNTLKDWERFCFFKIHFMSFYFEYVKLLPIDLTDIANIWVSFFFLCLKGCCYISSVLCPQSSGLLFFFPSKSFAFSAWRFNSNVQFGKSQI